MVKNTKEDEKMRQNANFSKFRTLVLGISSFQANENFFSNFRSLSRFIQFFTQIPRLTQNLGKIRQIDGNP